MIETIKNFFRRYFRTAVIYISGALSVFSFVLAIFLSYVYFYDIPNYQTIGKLPTSLRGSIEFIRDLRYLPYKFEEVSLPVYRLYIDVKDYQEMVDALPKDWYNEILRPENRVKSKATLVYDGKEHGVSVNFRGDSYINWAFDKKSWSIEFLEGEFGGLTEIKLRLPEDEPIYIGEYLNSFRARKLGLPAVDDKLVILQINDGPRRLYYQQEDWTPRFLTKNFGNANGNLYGESAVEDPIYESTKYWNKYVSVAGEENDFSDIAYLLDFIKKADSREFKEKIFKIIDEDNFYNWQVLLMLAGSDHMDATHNMRFYFDKDKNKFFIIPWDISVWDYVSRLGFEVPRAGKQIYDIDGNYNPLINRILDTPEFYLERNRRLWSYIKDDENINEDIAFIDQAAALVKPAVFQDSNTYLRSAKADAALSSVRSNTLKNIRFLRERLDKADAFVSINQNKSSSVAELEFYYASASPINFSGFHIPSVSSPYSDKFWLYEDTDENGLFGGGDLIVSDLKYENGGVSVLGLDRLLYSDRVYGEYKRPITIQRTRKKFFIVSTAPFHVQGNSASFRLFNEVTGSVLEVGAHVNNQEIFD